ncbi:junctional adhesion molecule A-like [Scomber scombrus]|uniref:junctional adhesion molecule A-like n=1 Tax=Scomber scombrus TaxID=13677 RepID=UPI002DDC1CCA|nr:junctional adhesion molecule A-like [Scomber scombrus]
MEIALLYLMLSATVNILPNRSQFFGYESISLSCGTPANSSSWKLKRNTTSQTSVSCNSGWGMSKQSSCFIEDAYPSDSGVYWCESERGCSDSINITVTVGMVILESPTLPVTEGDKVELLCSYKDEKTKKPVSNVTATFYKDGAFIGSQPTGKMLFPAVSSSDSGLYGCAIPSKGRSPQSWMDVTAHAASPPLLPTPRIVTITLLAIVYIVLIIVCVKVHRRWAQARAEAKKITFDDPSRK